MLVVLILAASSFSPAVRADESESWNEGAIVNVAAVSTTSPFSLRSLSASSAYAGGTCLGSSMCNGSAGHCGCETVTGTAIATGIGKATFSAQLTSNLDDCIGTGDTPIMCCPTDGTMTLTNGRNSINLQLVGNRCNDNGFKFPVVNNLNFALLKSTGKFSSSIGTGVIEFSNLGVSMTSSPTWVSGTGMIQINSGL